MFRDKKQKTNKNKTKQKTKEQKTKQNKTKKTKQNKTKTKQKPVNIFKESLAETGRLYTKILHLSMCENSRKL